MAEMFEISETQRCSIVTDTTLMLGELQWYLLRSSKLMSDKRDRVWEEASYGIKIERSEPTGCSAGPENEGDSTTRVRTDEL